METDEPRGWLVRKWKTPTGEERASYVLKFAVTAPNGEVVRMRRRAQVQSEKGASQEVQRVRATIMAGTYRKRTRLTLGDVAKEFLESADLLDLRPSSQRAYRVLLAKPIVPALGPLPISEVKDAVLDKFRLSLRTGKKGQTVAVETQKNTLRTLKRLLRWAKARGHISHVPEIAMPKSHREATEKFLTVAEVDALLTATTDPEERALVVVLARVGLRVGELLGLERGDLADGAVCVRRSVVGGEVLAPKTKTGRRVVPLSPQAAAALREQEERREAERRLFPYESREQVTNILLRLSRKAKIRRVGPHSLRHHWASVAVSRGVPLTTLMRWGGWSSLSMVERYGKDLVDETSGLISRLDGVGS